MPEKKQCACGCGRTVTKGQQVWIPGHDHRAIHERIARDHGSTLEFIEWYDAQRDRMLANQKAAGVTLTRGQKAAATRAANRAARNRSGS